MTGLKNVFVSFSIFFSILFSVFFSLSTASAGPLCPVVEVLLGDFAPGLEEFDENQSLSNLGFSPSGGGEMTVGGFTFYNDGEDRVSSIKSSSSAEVIHFDSEYGAHMYVSDKAVGCAFLYQRDNNSRGKLVAKANCDLRGNPSNPSCSR